MGALYIADERGGSVSGYSITGADGVLLSDDITILQTGTRGGRDAHGRARPVAIPPPAQRISPRRQAEPTARASRRQMYRWSDVRTR